MKLFIYEHITSGALVDQTLPDSLAQEGDVMLSAILQDCHALKQCEIFMLRDVRLPAISIIDLDTRHYCHWVSFSSDFQHLWEQCLDDADAVFIIAPETGNVLTQLQQQVLNANKIILGCLPTSIALTTNKLACDQHLAKHDVATPQSSIASNWSQQKFESADGYIMKPIDGAGCIDTLRFDSGADLEHYLAQQTTDILSHALIQKYITGIPASLSLLMSAYDCIVLATNRQKIVRKKNKLIFNGCIVNGIEQHVFSLSQATELAIQIQRAIPGLWGFVGVDIVLANKQVYVVDINPRLTTSYIGLQQSLALNPMSLLFTMQEEGMAALPNIGQRQQVEITL